LKLVKESLSQTFTRGSEDKLSTLGIGRRESIIKWLKEYGIFHYKINDDFSIDTFTVVNLMAIKIKELPSYIQFNSVDGGFNISSNYMKSLRGCPIQVAGNFKCSHNFLKTLEGGPQQVGMTYIGSYECHNNELISLKGSPETVGHDFNCGHNLLTDLDYAPNYVGHNLVANENNIDVLEIEKFKKYNGVEGKFFY